MASNSNLIRPTQISRDVYITFVNKCRSDGINIRDTLNRLIETYNEKGEKIF